MANLLVSSFDFNGIFANVVSEWYYYVAVLGLVVLLTLFFIIKKPIRSLTYSKTQKLVHTATFTALCTVVNTLTYYPASNIAISFMATLCIVAGFMLGAKCAFAVGFIGDLIGAIIFPAGVYNPLIGIASGLMGLIPGIIFDYFRGNVIVKIIISSILCLLICTASVNTFALWLMYGMGKKTFWAYLIVRLPWQSIVAVINSVLSIWLIVLIKKLFTKNKFDYYLEKKKKQSA